jgi:hypothetical protein
MSTSSAKEVHYELGHLSLEVLKKIRPEVQSVSELVCESCIHKKHVRASHPSKVISWSYSFFILVHFDI